MKNKLDTWDHIWQQADKVSNAINDYLRAGLPTLATAKIKPVIKDYENLIDMISQFDKVLRSSIKPIKIKLPFESEEFKNTWQYWKDYLLETFDVEYTSRREQMSLEHLSEISDKKEEKAIRYLKYAMATGYKNFFKVTGKTMNSPVKGEGEKDGDFE